MYKIWLIRDKHSSRIIPLNQPVVADSKLFVGNGRDVFDDLPEVGAPTDFVRKRLGPYRVNFDTDGFQTDPGYYVGTTLEAGTIVETAWLECVTPFDENVGAFLAINFCTEADPEGTYFGPVFYDLDGAGQNNPDSRRARPILNSIDTISNLPIRLVSDLQIRVGGFFDNPESLTEGSVDLYLLISEPA